MKKNLYLVKPKKKKKKKNKTKQLSHPQSGNIYIYNGYGHFCPLSSHIFSLQFSLHSEERTF